MGEFLALLGAFQTNIPATVIPAFGYFSLCLLAMGYTKSFHGGYSSEHFDEAKLTDLSDGRCFILGL
ncbi:MAG: hypothetical protein Ct9H90mP25_3180 [Gammaproteobacteria bacterium]|nr:MAG: hypothetical protein Ct9H90mP25_3180 [Gammaproteobacteria bacterium]